jgi:hypothetical protein
MIKSPYHHDSELANDAAHDPGKDTGHCGKCFPVVQRCRSGFAILILMELSGSF